MRSSVAISALLFLISMGSSAGEQADALPRAGDVCATIYEIEEHPTGDLQESEEPTQACTDILRCLIEARRKAGLVEGSSSTRGPNVVCERLSSLVELSPDRAQELAESVSSELPSSPGGRPSICRTFLSCIADRGAAGQPDRERVALVGAAALKAELDRICTRVSIASTLSPEQIRQLIEDCDALSELFRSSGDPKSKLFLRRLEMCRSFFEYSLQLQELEEDPIDEP